MLPFPENSGARAIQGGTITRKADCISCKSQKNVVSLKRYQANYFQVKTSSYYGVFLHDMEKVELGGSGMSVARMGLGCWGMSDAYGRADRSEAIATIRLAVEMGISLLDTADVYGGGDNEKLIAEAIKGLRSQVVIATKFGFVGDEHGNLTVCGKPEYVRQACEGSLQRLATDVIDIYHLHRIDPEVEIEETVGAMADLVREGKVRALALSEVSAQTLSRAEKIHHISVLQSEYSLFSKEIENDVLAMCREAGTAVLAFSPLGRGFLSGQIVCESQLEKGDYRAGLPRFQGQNLQKNLEILGKIRAMAEEKNLTASQLALAWLLNQGKDIIPIPGMKRRKYLHENLAAMDVRLTADEIARLRQITSGIAGSRHNESNLKFIDA